MTEPTTEEKIQLLVRSVLEAVDARLDAVRHEIAAFSNDVEQRHHHVLESMSALDARITELAARSTTPTDDTTMARLTADLDALRLRVESLSPNTASSPAAEVDVHTVAPSPPHDSPSVPGAAPGPDATVVTGTHQITREELDEISRPFVTHITTQVPVVPDPTGHHEPVEHMPVRVPPMVAPHFGSATHTVPADGPAGNDQATAGEPDAAPTDEIDLDQLASLLNERLGSLSLPTRSD